MNTIPGVIVARPKRPLAVLICGKCVRKAGEGQAIRKAVKAALSDQATADRRPGKLVETKCLGLCPKRAVALAGGASLARGELLVVKRAADVPAAIEALTR
ncbi:(2Fe-2S) ferredoxin domain-containing protein [Lichenihabitans sp. Uapishka_5]|uniref:(2Fe-2S) ferredoxin domain-containing protein n=1 Tax=Lichenihabitans sp. Uapishka_5 TaxID=3037302 RepID=UPI0029E8159F|nr:(2Fe-2S) ferredoxin domain-containing protein [Lichenihabitans sp. Uapishka_5]MDX7952885.1 (2Fe-2S) ferredoxin domain-containing protein [Lichenihabitans sp. Uapishka_5]